MTLPTEPGPWWLIGSVVACGGALGLWMSRQLAKGGYRLDDEWQHPLPRRPWLVAGLVPVVWGLLAWRAGGPATLLTVPALLLVGCVGVALAWIDVDVHRLPHGLTYPCALGVLALVAVACAVTGDWSPAARALLSGVAAYLVLFMLALVSRGQFGLGDVTLGGILGVALGHLDARLPWWALAFAFLLSGVVAAAGLLTRRLSLRSDVAFGPYLLVGALLAVLVG